MSARLTRVGEIQEGLSRIKGLSYLLFTFTVSLLPTFGHADLVAVETVNAHYERSGAGGQGFNSGDARFAVGPNNNLVVDSIEVEGQLLQALRKADYGRIQRRERNECNAGVYAPGEYICGEKKAGFWEATALGNVNNNRSENPADYADVFSSLVINRGIDNPFRNQSNNIERLDVIFRDGITAPLPQFLPWTGFMVSERAGNNTFRIAPILGLDAAGDPSQFGRLRTGLGSGVTDGNECLDLRTFSSFMITDTSGATNSVDFYKMAINRYRNQDMPAGVGNGPLQHINTVQQCVFSQFFSFQELDVNAGQRVYGYSVFPRDVTEQMDLVGLTNVPLNTNAEDNDSPDFFGGGGAAFMLPPQARVGGVVYHSQTRVPLANVELALINQTTGNALPMQCFSDGLNTQTTQSDGRYVFNLALGDAACPGDLTDYRIATTRTPTGIQRAGSPAAKIPTQPSTLSTDLCQADGQAIDTSVDEGCQIQSNITAPELGQSTTYFLNMSFSASSQLVDNNHIPLDGLDPDEPQPPVETLVQLTKEVSRSTVSIGDIVDYTLGITNVNNVTFTGLLIRDEPPVGFHYEPDTARFIAPGADGVFGTADDVIEKTTPALQGTTLVFGPWDLLGNEVRRLTYKMRVGNNVLEGRHNNRATPNKNGEPVGPTSVAGVRLVYQPDVEKSTVIGKVFHDRDKDGIQDSVLAKKLRLKIHTPDGVILPSDVSITRHDGTKSREVDWQKGAYLGRLVGRLRETDPESASELTVKVRVPEGTKAADVEDWQFELASSNGLKLESRGLVAAPSVSRFGDVASGFNSQDLRIRRRWADDHIEIRVRNLGIMEEGIPGVRLATTKGLLVETDANGRYHLADAESGNWWRGGNFIIKVDPVTLPKGSAFTTENPLMLRLTADTLTRMNFGVTLPPQTVPETQITIVTPGEVVETLETVSDGSLPPVRFKSGKADITEEYLSLLRPKIEMAKEKLNYTLSAVGHTDSVRVGLPETVRKFGNNQRLSEARAEVVADYLQEALSIPSDNIETAGRAQREPVATNATPEGRQLNRRTEVTLHYQQLKKTKLPDTTHQETRSLVGGGTLWALEDPLPNDPRLDVEATNVASVSRSGELLKPIEFHAYSNYNAFIKRWELMVYNESDSDRLVPLTVLEGKVLPFGQPIVWRAAGNEFVAGEDLNYVLRVYDDKGRWDETKPRILRVLSVKNTPKKESSDLPPYSEIYGRTNLAVQNIPLRGSRVRLYGHGVDKRYQLSFNNAPVFVDGKGSFAVEEHYPVGLHRLAMKYNDGEGLWTREIPVDVTGRYQFMVGMANLTVGQNDVSGNIEALAPDDRFDGSTYVDGRVAFYLKGKIQGKYLITAHLDTKEDDVSELNDNLKRKDPASIFRRLDPDRYYPVYGDDSTTVADVNTQGAYYLRVDWDKSRALWGNFHTNLTGSEFAQYSRSLYGAQLVYRAPQVTENGEAKHFLNTFASEAQTAAGHNEFRATGGSLYYLRHRDLVQGSEKIAVEIRDKDGIQVIERFGLSAGTDYEVDYLQGRIILSKPLSQIVIRRAPNIIIDRPLEGDDVFLLADYEYVPDTGDFENSLAGVRGKTWVADRLALGGTYVQENRDANDYELKGVDLTYKLGKGTYLKGEVAESQATQSSSGFLSTDGGLSFAARNLAGTDRSGQAVGVEARVNLAELGDGSRDGDIKVWSKKREAGFSSSRADDGIETEDSGLSLRLQVSDKTKLAVRANQLERTGVEKNTNASVQIDQRFNQRLSAGLEVKQQSKERQGEAEEDATIIGAMLSYLLSDETRVYAKVQSAVEKSDNFQDNDAATIGVSSRINPELSLGAEVVSGDRGDALVVNGDYALSEKASLQASVGFGDGADSQIGATYSMDNGTELYGSFTQSVDRTDAERSIFTLGQRRQFGNGLNLFVENQFGDGDEGANIGHVVGLDMALNRSLHISTSVQASEVKDKAGNRIERDVLSAGVSLKRGVTKLSNRVELRRDKGNGTEEEQWLTSNGIDYRASADHRYIGKLNFATTEDKITGRDVARFGEASIGWAYRPIDNDRLNLLTRYTYRYDQGSQGQQPLQNDQRIHILSVDGDYQFTRAWALGGKVASRQGEERQGNGGGDWLESGADLFALRGRYLTPFSIEALLEYRWLKEHAADDTRHGALLAGYKKFSKHLRLGLGYSFAKFEDDLRELDYDNNGWFIDLSAQY